MQLTCKQCELIKIQGTPNLNMQSI